MSARAWGLALGVLADAALGDPRRGHPVAGFGRWASAVEKQLWRDSRPWGAAYVAVTVAPVVAVGVAAERLTAGRPVARALTTALATWVVLGMRSLSVEGEAMARALASDDLASARARLPHLCGRTPDGLPSDEVARATVESLAENTNDAVVAPLFWGALCGVPGLLGHRALNTLDAMVGHRSPRLARFGTAAARLDDAAAWLPARLTGALACLLSADPGRAWTVMLRDAHDHPSPNGGWCEAAWAGALGVRLGGRNVYAGRVEVRGTLGDPEAPPPDAEGVRAAAVLVRTVAGAATVLAVAGSALAGWARGRAAGGRA